MDKMKKKKRLNSASCSRHIKQSKTNKNKIEKKNNKTVENTITSSHVSDNKQ